MAISMMSAARAVPRRLEQQEAPARPCRSSRSGCRPWRRNRRRDGRRHWPVAARSGRRRRRTARPEAACSRRAATRLATAKSTAATIAMPASTARGEGPSSRKPASVSRKVSDADRLVEVDVRHMAEPQMPGAREIEQQVPGHLAGEDHRRRQEGPDCGQHGQPGGEHQCELGKSDWSRSHFCATAG